MSNASFIHFQEVLQRVETGTTTAADADFLRDYETELAGDRAELLNILEDALVFEVGVTFKEEDHDDQSTCKRLPLGSFSGVFSILGQKFSKR